MRSLCTFFGCVLWEPLDDLSKMISTLLAAAGAGGGVVTEAGAVSPFSLALGLPGKLGDFERRTVIEEVYDSQLHLIAGCDES